MSRFLMILLLFALNVQADDVDRAATQIFDTTMSPYCPGRTLSACPSGDAKELREQIISWLRAGESREQINRRLVGTFGSEVFGVPDESGFGLVGWLAPAAFFVLGIALVLRFSRSGKGEQPQGQLDPAQVSRLEDELKQRMK